MSWDSLYFLASPVFVLPWYGAGLIGAAWAVRDMQKTNRMVDRALKWAWPIIIIFFSVTGLLLYLVSSRPPGIAQVDDDAAQAVLFRDYSRSTFRKVIASVTHCVGGDGLGIMTAMVVARLVNMSFWEEYWFEYAVGFAFGWFIFQFFAMKMMTDSSAKALWMGGRAEFFSMMTVMAGMGAVMGYVTPHVVGQQPKPYTFAFWGFGAFGLMAGFALTFPMNWLLVALEWKHGLGMKAKQAVEQQEAA